MSASCSWSPVRHTLCELFGTGYTSLHLSYKFASMWIARTENLYINTKITMAIFGEWPCQAQDPKTMC